MKLNSCFLSLPMLAQYGMQKVARASERRCAQLVKNRRRPRSPTPTHQTCKNLHQGVPAARSGHYCTHISPFTRSRRTSTKAATQDSASRVALAQQQGCLSDAFAVSRCCGSRVVLVPKFARSVETHVRARLGKHKPRISDAPFMFEVVAYLCFRPHKSRNRAGDWAQGADVLNEQPVAACCWDVIGCGGKRGLKSTKRERVDGTQV